MNLTRLRLTLRRYAPIIAVFAIVLIGAISFGTIWYLRQAEGPVAPTAPTSQPSASQNVCSLEWVVQNKCVDMKIVNASGQEVAAGANGKITVATKAEAEALRIYCEGSPGTNNASFRIMSNDNTWRTYEKIKTDKISQNLPDPNDADCQEDPNSASCSKIPTLVRAPYVTSKLPIDFNQKTEFEVSCKPYAGDFGATKASIDATCRQTIVIASAPVVACSAACTTDAQCGGTNTCINGMCRNPQCSGEADCTCQTTGGACSASCTTDAQCGAPNTCISGMCRNPQCSGEADCTCQTTGGACSAACTTDAQCGAPNTCISGMCRNPQCSGETDCTCNTTATPLTCTTGAYDEQFSDATFDAKLEKGGRGTLTVTSNEGVAEILPSVTSDRYVSLQSKNLITGNLNAAVDVTDFTTTPGAETVLTRLELAGENGFPTYRIDWRKGAGGASQIVAHRYLTAGGGALDTSTAQVIPGDSDVTLKAIREGNTLRMYYQIKGKNHVQVASFTATENLRPMLIVSNNNTTESSKATVDNFKLICETDITNPPGICKDSCEVDADCGSGLVCSGNMCRDKDCTGESDCTCDDEEEPDEDLDSVLAVTELTCSKKDFTATITLDKDEDPDSGVSVRFVYNGQTITRTTDSDGKASATFTHVSGDKVLTVTPSEGYDTHTKTIRFDEDCSSGGGSKSTPTPTPVASCSKTCVTSSDCSNNLTCSNGMCRNPSCTNEADCTCNNATPTPSALPEAGSSTQLIAMVAVGVLVIGLGVTRFKFLKK